MTTYREDPWMMLGKCHTVTDLHHNKECRPIVARGVRLRLVRGLAWIVISLAKGLQLHTWILSSNEEAAHRLCGQAFKTLHREEPQMVHPCSNRDRIPIRKACSAGIQIQILFPSIQRLFAQATWEELQDSPSSLHLFVIILMHQVMAIIDHCLWTSLRNRLTVKIWIDYELL